MQCKKVIICCKKSGADVIKFQTFIPRKCCNKKLNLAKYQRNNKNKKEKNANMIKGLYLNLMSKKTL